MVEPTPFRVTRPQGGTGGPEDPMLELRVAPLEDDMKDIRSSLKSIELSLAEMKGRMAGIDSRFASLPTTWTILTITFTTWAVGSGILIFALNVLKR